MRVFITGADGFIGRHVMDLLLSSGHEVLASALCERETSSGFKKASWIFGDILDCSGNPGKIRRFNPDAMIHLAWQGIPDYGYEMSKKNIDLAATAIKYVSDVTSCRKIVGIGSCWEYGRRKGECRETDAHYPDSYFSWAKNSINGYFKVRCKESNIDFKWMRIFYVYGPGQKEKSLIPSMIKSFSEGRMPEIRHPGNRNDYVYVKDAAKAIVLALDKNSEDIIYNVGSGKSVPAYEIARITAEKMGCQSIFKQWTPPECIENEDFWANTQLIQDKLGWSPKYSLDKGISETIAYYKAGGNHR